jgi:hypothetical protein
MTKHETEEALQADCYIWAHNTIPEIRGLLCYNLNNSPNKRAASINKGMGLQPGRSDMVLYWKGNAYMIEMKLPGKNQQEPQKVWELKVRSHGFEYYVIKSLDEFKELIYNLTLP